MNTAVQSKWQALLAESDLPLNGMTAVQRGRHDVLLVRTDKGLRAFGNLCPHKMFPLVEGKLENGLLTCKAHRWVFSVDSGAGVNPRGCTLRVYPVRVANGMIEVDLA